MDEHARKLLAEWDRTVESFGHHMAASIVRWNLKQIAASPNAQPRRFAYLLKLVKRADPEG
jgi:hypothetical protein